MPENSSSFLTPSTTVRLFEFLKASCAAASLLQRSGCILPEFQAWQWPAVRFIGAICQHMVRGSIFERLVGQR
ncbi:hypothetical protein ACVJGD_008350 [Bradyrhizobium sp. USDA 10063]